MTGEKKSSESTNRLSVKNGKKLLSRTSKPSSSTISSPPKAAIATPTAKQKDEVHRRRNLNDILRRRSGDATAPEKSTPLHDGTLDNNRKASEEAIGVDARMADRVAELERDLSIAREEQNVLRAAVEEARQRALEERGVTLDLHQRNAQTRQNAPDAPEGTFEDSESKDENLDNWSDAEVSLGSLETSKDRPIASIHQAQDDLLRQNHDLRYKLVHLQDQLLSQDTTYRANLSHAQAHSDAEWNDLHARLHATEKESQERLQQLLSLKSSIASLTRSESQVTDAELADAFEQLANRIREWVISNFRRSKLDVNGAELPAATLSALRALTLRYTEIESTDRLALYQALISHALARIFDEEVVLGAPESGPLGAIRVFAQRMDVNGTEYREWRRATIRLIESREEAQVAVLQGRNEMLHRIAEETAHVLLTLTSVTMTTNAQAALRSILSTAANLQHTLALQKARYQVLFFQNSTSSRHVEFDELRMESINDFDSMVEGDEDMLSSRRQFLFCVSPCLEKFGDEWGENLEISNVLLRARVCCGVG